MNIDEKNNRIIKVDGSVITLYSPEGFKIISDLWIKIGWDQKYLYGFTWMGRPIIQNPDDQGYDPINGDHGIIRNSIIEQLDIIYELVGTGEVYIQLDNEPWHKHEYKENLWPCARAYFEDMVEIAYIIKGLHPDYQNVNWDFSNAKIALRGQLSRVLPAA